MHRHQRIRIFLFLWLVFAFAVPCFGFGEQLPLKELQHTRWGLRDGLSGAGASLAQTKDGFIWIGTADGLFRFDGVTFERYRPFYGTMPAVPIHCLLATDDDALWIGFEDNHVSRLHAGRITNYGPEDGIAVGRVRFLVPDAEGGIFFSTVGSVMHLLNGRIEKVRIPNWSLPIHAADTARRDSSGTLWITSEGHTFYLLRGTHAFQPVPLVTGRVAAIIETPTQMGFVAEGKQDGVFWVARPRTNPEVLPYASYSAFMIRSSDGSIWIGDEPGGLYREREPAELARDFDRGFTKWTDRLTEKDGLSSNRIYAVLEDYEGDVWTLTSRGLDRFRTPNVRAVSLRPESIDPLITTAPDGNLWYSCWTSTKEDFRWTRLQDGSLLKHPSDRIRRAFPVGDGSAWFTTESRDLTEKGKPDGKLWHWTSSGVHEVFRPAGLQTFRVTSLAVDSKKRTWVVVDGNGNWMLDEAGRWHSQDLPLSDGRHAFLPLSGVGDDVAFMNTQSLYVLNDDSPRVLLSHLPSGIAIRSAVSFEGRVLLGTNQGIGEVSGGTIRPLNLMNGDMNRPVLAMLSSKRSGVWIATTGSLLYIKPEDLRRHFAEPDKPVPARTFDLFSDLPEPFGFGTTIVEDAKGEIWLTTSTNVLRIQPTSLRRNERVPTVVIARAAVAEKSVDPLQPVTLAPNSNSLRLDYTSISLPAPEKIRFRYKLEGFEDRWVDTEGRRDVSFVGLPPGHYVFRVVGSNDDGLWNTTGATFQFTVQPRLYQAAWFQGLVAVCLCLLLTAGVILRERRIRAFFRAVADARESERRQVAHELHDDFFPSVYGLFLSINRVTATLPEQTVQRVRLQSIVDESGDVLEHGRELIQKLRSSSGLRSDLFDELAVYGRTQEAVFSISFVSDRTGPELALPQERHEEASSIIREALWNAFQHSEARTISLTMKVSHSEVSLIVSDDGKGLPQVVLDHGRPGHYGLATMRERAEILHAKLQIKSSINQGTQIKVIFPAF